MNFALSHGVKEKEAYVYPVTTATPTFYPHTNSIFNEVLGYMWNCLTFS